MINFFTNKIFGNGYLDDLDESGSLENEILEKLVKNSELVAMKHEGEWQHLDNERDLEALEKVLEGIR